MTMSALAFLPGADWGALLSLEVVGIGGGHKTVVNLSPACRVCQTAFGSNKFGFQSPAVVGVKGRGGTGVLTSLCICWGQNRCNLAEPKPSDVWEGRGGAGLPVRPTEIPASGRRLLGSPVFICLPPQLLKSPAKRVKGKNGGLECL